MNLHDRAKELSAEALEVYQLHELQGVSKSFMVGYISMHAAMLEGILHKARERLTDGERAQFDNLIKQRRHNHKRTTTNQR